VVWELGGWVVGDGDEAWKGKTYSSKMTLRDM